MLGKQTSVKIAIIAVFTCISASGLNAQDLGVDMKDGSKRVKELNTVRSISFEKGEISINFLDNQKEVYNISDVQKIVFENVTSVEEERTIPVEISNVNLYPNPVEDYVSFENLPEGNYQIIIYDAFGTAVKSFDRNEASSPIDMSELSSGMYYILIDSTMKKMVKL